MWCLCNMGLHFTTLVTTSMGWREQTDKHQRRQLTSEFHPNRSRVKHDNQHKPCSFPSGGEKEVPKIFQYIYILQARKAKMEGHPSTYEIMKSRTLGRAVTTNFLGFSIKPLSAPVPLLASAGDQPVPCKAQPCQGIPTLSYHPQHSFVLLMFGLWWHLLHRTKLN